MPDTPIAIRDRIQSLVRIKARDLVPNPLNPRQHPEKQKSALQGVLSEIGYVDALLVRKLPDGRYEICDGHLRAETTPDMEVPCLVCDLTDDEALKVLASFDPLAGMATFSPQKLDLLLPQVKFEAPAVGDMLKALAKQAGAEFGNPVAVIEDEVPEPPAVPITQPGDMWYMGDVHFECESCGKRYEYEAGLAMDGVCPCDG